MTEIAFVVELEEAGKRLDQIVAERSGLSRTVASALPVLVDGAAATKSDRVQPGMRIVVTLPVAAEPPSAQAIDLEVVHEDDYLIVVNKAAGMVVHPAPGHEQGTLVNALLSRFSPAGGEIFRPGIVHRLDSGTSGLIVVAKKEESFEALSALIAKREMRREYIALVEGTPESPSATIDAPIGRSPRHRKKMAVVGGGREAITHYRVVSSFKQTSLLDVRLETGRTHQIRVHLAEIGHPVAGDFVYGGKRALSKELELDRPFLHAARLSFTHPMTREHFSFTAELPDDLARALSIAKR